MCVICVSERGKRQPTTEEMKLMFRHNPDGAGYMYARGGQVHVHKGFMTFEDFMVAIRQEAFTDCDPVVYHFRISTQGGVNPQMCQPFGFTSNLEQTKVLDCTAHVGIAHNGIIQMTTDTKDKEYSDTAHFIAEYLPHLIRNESDIHDFRVLYMIEQLIGSKMALMDSAGNIETCGTFTDDDGIKVSNTYYKPITDWNVYRYPKKYAYR